MRRTRIRAKVAILLALPLVALLALTFFEVRAASNEAADVRSETQLASAVNGPAGVVTRLQDERTWISLELNGLDESMASVVGYDETRSATDESIDAFRADVESKGGAVEATFRDAFDALGSLDEIRSDIDAFTAPRTLDNMPIVSEFYDRYSEVIQALVDANARITGQVRDADLRRGTELVALATQQFELQANLGRVTVTAATFPPAGVSTAEIATIAGMLSDFDRANEKIESTRGRYAAVVREHYPAEFIEQVRGITVSAIDTGSIGNMDTYLDIVDESNEEGFPPLRQALADAVTDRADTLNDQATARQRLFVFLSLVATVLGALMTWLVSRSITRPLRSLTRQARDMADRRLPSAVREILDTPPGQDVEVAEVQPVVVTSRDEVSDVVAALNTVQESALDLAAEQAVLRRNIADSFVSLGRRNQNLLSRQLDFITTLETNETNPDILGSLFQLDHLATRMRRNAESLLVLAGIDPPRKWAAPLRISDAIRASVGEVEDYQRVRVDTIEPAMVQGSVAADLAHLLAELVENSLTFSSPAEVVVIHGLRLPGGGYRVTVIDQGLGMSAADIAQANARLAGSESMTVAPSKFLGHHVAGNLAARHGIRIQLEAGALRGVFATVDLPPGCLSDEAPGTHATTGPDPARPRRPAARDQAAGALVATAPGTSAFPPEPSFPAPSPGPLGQPAPAAAGPPGAPPGTPVPALGSPMGSMPSMPGPPPAPAAGGGGPVVPPRDQLLAALETHARTIQSRQSPGGRQGGGGPFGPRPPVDGGVTSGSELPRRVRGAQIPPTQAPPLRAYHEQWAPRKAADIAGRGGAGSGTDGQGDDGDADQTRADEVHSFLSGFSAGVRRGRDEAHDEERKGWS